MTLSIKYTLEIYLGEISLEKKYLVSVIMPAFNDERFIGEAISSVLNQTYPYLELIVVDDCSIDNTIKIVEQFSDTRLHLYSNEKNMGAAYSRNLAISKAKGDYIAFLDGDDVWLENKIEKQLFFMVQNNILFSSCNYEVIDENSESKGVVVTAPKKITHSKFLRSSYIGCLTAMYKRSVFENLSIPDDIAKRNDYALWLKLSERTDCYNFACVLALYRKRASSISSGKKTALFKHHISLFIKLYGFSFLKSWFYSVRNVFYYFIRRLWYRKKK